MKKKATMSRGLFLILLVVAATATTVLLFAESSLFCWAFEPSLPAATSSLVVRRGPTAATLRRRRQRQQDGPLPVNRVVAPWCIIAATTTRLSFSKLSTRKSDDEDEDIDWRDFRAQLVMNEQQLLEGKNSSETILSDEEPLTSSKADDKEGNADPTASTTTTKNEQKQLWAYDSGDVIEKGSLILSNVEQDFGYGLKQQYFHKSVLLVLEHDSFSTKGIVLNRPTSLILSETDFIKEEADDGTTTALSADNPVGGFSSLLPLSDKNNTTDHPPSKWRFWYGGEVQDLASGKPEFLCLHCLSSDAARRVSEPVLPNHVVQYTSLGLALELVKDGVATSDDFWLFGGYAGWSPGQLQDELERQSWYMVATDASSVWAELHKLQQALNGPDGIPLPPGVDMWERLMERIGRGDEARRFTVGNNLDQDNFDDLMLREWARENLLFEKEDEDTDKESLEYSKRSIATPPGTLLRGSSKERSPFLLAEQGFHKSIVLVTQDEKDFTIGLLLNRPLPDKAPLGGDYYPDRDSIPQRYGGKFGTKNNSLSEKPVFWLHCHNPRLHAARIGQPLIAANSRNGIWKCSREQVLNAVRSGNASIKDFLCIEGLTVWPKLEGFHGSLQEDIAKGHFELVPPDQIQKVWTALLSQEVLSALNIDKNIMFGNMAWEAAGDDVEATKDTEPSRNLDGQIAALCDNALRSWMAAYLLDQPDLRQFENTFG